MNQNYKYSYLQYHWYLVHFFSRWDAPQTVEDMDGKEEEEEDRQLPPPGDI